MSKVYCLFLSLILVSVSSHAFEPVLDQQATFYFNLSFDMGQTSKTDHDFGFRFDRSLVQPGENMTMSQLTAKPAVLNLKLNNNGLKALKINGIDYTDEYYVYRGAEGGDAKTGAAKTSDEAETQPIPETTEQPKKKINVPLGVIIGILIGAVAIGSGA
jgi:hypothetical protein